MKPEAHKTLKDMAESDRPREKLMERGLSSLTDSELLGILIGSGTAEHTAVDVARIVLERYNHNLPELGRATLRDLVKCPGIGPARAVVIQAAMELGRRRSVASAMERPSITKASDAYGLLRPHLADLQHEEMWIVLLNRASKLIEVSRLSQGGMAGTVVDVRLLMKRALDCSASAIIMAHNHPSGNVEPSDDDKAITQRVAQAAKLFDISLLDHIIVGNERYYSFAQSGMI